MKLGFLACFLLPLFPCCSFPGHFGSFWGKNDGSKKSVSYLTSLALTFAVFER